MAENTDAELVAQAAAGDEDAFCSLVRKYQNYAYGTAIGIVSDLDLAQDVVQEAFLSAYLHLAKIRAPERFGGWLRGIVRHRAFRALREREQTRALVAAYGQTAEQSAPPRQRERPEDEPDPRELVRRALERVEPKNREVVGLFYIDGLSYDDIAQFLGVTRTTVKGRLQRARAQLREEIEMVRETMKDKELPGDFADEIGRLLSAWKERGKALHEEIARLAAIGAQAVDPLCRALDDPNVRVRRAATVTLAEIRDPRALEPILSALKEGRIHGGSATAIPGVRDAALTAVREGKPENAYWALRALAHVRRDDEVYRAVSEVFADRESPGHPNRGLAADVLCRIRPETALEVVTQALGDPDPQVRGWATWIAFKRNILPPVDVCLRTLFSSPGWGPWLAIHLVRRHGEAARPELERAMREGSHAERAMAAAALASPDRPDVFAVLMDELEHRSKGFIPIAVPLTQHYARQLMAELEKDPERAARLPIGTIVESLDRNRFSEAGPLIQRLAREGKPKVRATCLRIVARKKNLELLTELRALLRAGKPAKVAHTAFWQFLHLRDRFPWPSPPEVRDRALALAREMFVSKQWTERKAATALLRRWKQLTPAQRETALRDPHPAVRASAAPVAKGRRAAASP